MPDKDWMEEVAEKTIKIYRTINGTPCVMCPCEELFQAIRAELYRRLPKENKAVPEWSERGKHQAVGFNNCLSQCRKAVEP